VTNVREAERVGPLALDDADGIEELRRALDRAGYRIEQIEDVLQVERLSSRPADVALQLRRLPPSAPFGTLVRLFLLGAAASQAERLALVEAHQLDQRLACRDGGLAHLHTSLSLDEGLGFVIGVDLETAELLPAL